MMMGWWQKPKEGKIDPCCSGLFHQECGPWLCTPWVSGTIWWVNDRTIPEWPKEDPQEYKMRSSVESPMKFKLEKKHCREFLLWLSGLQIWLQRLQGTGRALAWHSGLRIWHCCSCGISRSSESDSLSGLRTSLCLFWPDSSASLGLSLSLSSHWIGYAWFFILISFLFSFLFFFGFSGTHLQHMEVLTGAIAAGLHHSHSNTGSKLWPTYTTAHSNAGSLTHWAGPGIEPASSRIPVGFVSTAPQWELPLYLNFWKQILPPDEWKRLEVWIMTLYTQIA